MHSIFYMSYHGYVYVFNIPYHIFFIYIYMYHIIEGSLKVKLPKICTDENEVGRVREEKRREEKKQEDQRRERVRRKKMQVRESRKVASHSVLLMFWGSRGSKSRLAKAAGAEPSGRWEMKNCTLLMAWNTFRSQNVQNAPGPDHCWKLRCQKSARCCGAKHMSKSKCTKHTMFNPLLEVAMSKKCTPLWREARKV